MSQEKISIPIGLDASGISNDIQKASNNVGKATAGMAKGIAAAVGQSMGPFGELIEKADAFKAALSGISTGSKIMAGAIGIAGVAAVYSVKKAVEAYQEMRQAQDEATESAKRLADAQASITDTIASRGIAKGGEEKARKLLFQEYADASQRGDKAQMAKVDAQLERIRSGEATKQGEALLGSQALTSGGKSAIEEARFRNALKGVSTADLPSLRSQLSNVQEIQGRLSGEPMTREVAAQINANANAEKQLERLIKALEMRARDEEDRANAVLETFFDGSFRSQKEADVSAAPFRAMGPAASPYQVPTGYGVGGYTSTGGGGNIYGNTAGMSDRIRAINENVKIIADAAKAKSETPQFLTQ